MKKILLAMLLASTFQSLFAQDCSTTYGLFKEGARLEYTNYDKKGEASMVVQHTCQKVITRNDTLIATLEVKTTDKKGKETSAPRSYDVKCLAGVFFMDMRGLLPTQPGTAENPSMEVQVEGGTLEYPGNLKAGQTLPDADMVIKTSMGGMQLMQMTYHITNRKVESAEKRTTPAGTFDCLKITYDLEMKLLGNRTYHAVQWIAQNVGLIRTETYDKKGSLEGSMELTGLQK